MDTEKYTYDESMFIPMSDVNYTRPAQIPIRHDRFEYLTKFYNRDANDINWIMFHNPGHFLIYDKITRYCVFDATYLMLEKGNDAPPDELVAVISEIKISRDETRHPIIEDDFRPLYKLISNDL